MDLLIDVTPTKRIEFSTTSVTVNEHLHLGLLPILHSHIILIVCQAILTLNAYKYVISYVFYM